MNDRAFVPAVLWLVAVSSAALAEPRRPKLPPWEKFEERDQISLFRRDVPGSGVVAVRGEGVVDAPLLRVGSVLADPRRATAWPGAAETRVIRRLSDTEYLKWERAKRPFLIADRDFVLRVKLELKRRERQVIMTFHSVKDAAAPKAAQVRGELVYGTYVLTSIDAGRRTLLRAEMLCDQRGSLAKWMVNLLQKRWPYHAISELRRQVRRPDAWTDPELETRLVEARLV